MVCAALYTLQRRAYEEQQTDLTFKDWVIESAELHDNFFYWNFIMEYMKLFFAFMSAQRLGNFVAYIAALKALLPYVFALDHTHYSRWLPVLVFDCERLEALSKYVFDQFVDRGNFVISKTSKLHSRIAIDQGHEQNNGGAKSVFGGGDLLNKNDEGDALLRFITGTPEIMRCTAEYEAIRDSKTGRSARAATEHHENYPSFQMEFVSKTLRLVDCIESCINMFGSEADGPMVYINTAREMPRSREVAASIRAEVGLGREQVDSFVWNRLVVCSVPLTEPIKKNNILLPSNCDLESTVFHTITPKEDGKLLSSMKLGACLRKSEVLTALQYEPHGVPPTFTNKGKLYQTNKAYLLTTVKSLAENNKDESILPVRATHLVIDLSMLVVSIVNRRSTAGVKTVLKFFDLVWREITWLGEYSRIDLVGDNYTQVA